MAGLDVLSRLSVRRKLLAAALLGALAAAALPPVHAVPVLLLAIPGLLRLLDGATPGRAWWTGFWFGFGLHVVGLYWITEAILIESARFWWLVPLAVPALAALLALFTACACALATCAAAGLPRAIALAGAWVLSDLARQFVLSGFPWNPIGSVWAAPGIVGDIMLQPASVISVHGLTLITLLIAATPALGWRARLGAVAALALWATLALWIGFGVWRLSQPGPAAPGLSVVLVQGNIPQGQKWDRATAMANFDRHLALTRQGLATVPGPAVVVWPESASPFLLESDANARAAIADAINSAGPSSVARISTVALIGSVRFDAQHRPRNSLMAIDGPGPPVAIYDKAHLVPFGEYQPRWMPLPIQLVAGDGFAAGPGPQTFHLPGLPPVGPLICYEAIFPAGIVDPDDRPSWLVNVTDDSWFGNSTGPRQHLAAARLRAVEEGLPLMRAANTGISAGFDAFGRELGRLGMAQSGVLVLQLPGALPPTLFAQGGLAIPLVLALACVLPAVIRRRQPKLHP